MNKYIKGTKVYYNFEFIYLNNKYIFEVKI